MPNITVAAVVMRDAQMLFLRERGATQWGLPSGPLLDSDESVESAIRRVLEEEYGVRTMLEEPEFLTTAYEWHDDATSTLHNLFLVAPGGALILSGAAEQRWALPAEVESLPAPAWLVEALERQGEPEGAFEMPALENMMNLFQAGAATGDGSALIVPPGLRTWPGDQVQALAEMAQRLIGNFSLRELPPLAPVYVITGPAGAGKTTVAKELCRRFPRSAHVDMDELYHLVIGGYTPPGHGEGEEDDRQTLANLCAGNAAALTRNFTDGGFTVAIHGVFETRQDLDDLLRQLYQFDESMQIHLVTLLPDPATLRARDQGRSEDQRMHERSEQLRRIFEANGETRGVRLDSSTWSVEKTVDIILERRAEALLDPDGVEVT